MTGVDPRVIGQPPKHLVLQAAHQAVEVFWACCPSKDRRETGRHLDLTDLGYLIAVATGADREEAGRGIAALAAAVGASAAGAPAPDAASHK